MEALKYGDQTTEEKSINNKGRNWNRTYVMKGLVYLNQFDRLYRNLCSLKEP